jgi:hypothetical protein
MVGALVAALVTPAFAAITSARCAPQAENTLRWTCEVEVSEPTALRIGVRDAAGLFYWSWSEWAQVDGSWQHTLYNLPSQTIVDWRVEDASGGAVQGSFVSVLPRGLGGVRLETELDRAYWGSRYILFDTSGCDDHHYLVVWDVLRRAVTWYQDVDRALGTTPSSRVQVEGFTLLDDDVVAVIVDTGELLAWRFDGALVERLEYAACGAGVDAIGPCPHHDVARGPDGDLWVLTTSVGPSTAGTVWEDTCPTSTVLDHAVERYAADGALLDRDTVLGELGYDPVADPGPEPLRNICEQRGNLVGENVDFTHPNAIAVDESADGTTLWLSMSRFNEVVAYDPDADEVLWTLSGVTRPAAPAGDFDIVLGSGIGGDPSVWADPDDELTFGFQHDVRPWEGYLQVFDNHPTNLDDPSAISRVLRMQLDPGSGGARGVATIVGEWLLPADYGCTTRGSARTIEGTDGAAVLALCHTPPAIVMLDQSDGRRAPPAYTVRLDQQGSCPGEAQSFRGWYRAIPLGALGDAPNLAIGLQ